MRSLEDSVCCKRLGHLIRMDGNRLVSKVWGGKCDGKRARGRPGWMYAEQEAADLARGRMHRWEALDRELWKDKVRLIFIHSCSCSSPLNSFGILIGD